MCGDADATAITTEREAPVLLEGGTHRPYQ